MAKIRRADNPTLSKVFILLSQVCKAGENGMAEYDPGWNDERVANECKTMKIVVSRKRKDVYGEVRKNNNQAIIIKELQAEIDRLKSKGSSDSLQLTEEEEEMINYLLEDPTLLKGTGHGNPGSRDFTTSVKSLQKVRDNQEWNTPKQREWFHQEVVRNARVQAKRFNREWPF